MNKVENYLELKKTECEALRKIIQNTFSDYELEHGYTDAADYLLKREKEAVDNVVTIGESFILAYYYWTFDRDDKKLSKPIVVRETLYLTSTGFYKRFNKWYCEGFDRVMSSFNELNECKAVEDIINNEKKEEFKL